MVTKNEGHVALTSEWATSNKKNLTKTGKPSNEEFELIRQKFLLEISGMVRAHGIPDELVFNWDQTGINLVPGENWTLDKKGDKGCHPHYARFPADFDVWHSPNHWANQETTFRFIHNIIPYVQKK